MSDSVENLWSNNSNAPRISSPQYIEEKKAIAGSLVGAILYGIVIALFFQCVRALVDPINNLRRSVKWGLIAHTTALFLLSTMHVAMELYMISSDFIDGRNFPGADGLAPGPIGHDSDTYDGNTKFLAAYDVSFPLNQWLVDGLLLYRCYVIYLKNPRALAFPCLLYAASFVTGIARVCINTSLTTSNVTVINILLLHCWDVQHAIGINGLYAPIITMLVESCALYSIALLLYFLPLVLGNLALDFMEEILGPIQAIAPYLIILRVAKRRELTHQKIAAGSGVIASIRFRSQGMTNDDETPPCDNSTGSVRCGDEGDALNEGHRRVEIGAEKSYTS